MSTRALRKAQKQRELVKSNAQEEDEASEEDEIVQPRKQQSAFVMLDQIQDESGTEADHDIDESRQDAGHTDPESRVETVPIASSIQTSNRKKKKKKKKYPSNQTAKTTDVDDIDEALKSLSTQDSKKSGLPPYNQDIANEIFASDSALLSVDPHHLQVANEMRRVFGRAAFTADQEEREDRRNHPIDGQQVGLAEAVSGRAASGGPGLPAVLRRRNIFVQGNEEWPKNTSNGLTMEIEKRGASGITTYRFVHGQQYKISQMTFAQCVATMDPTNMVNMLRFYPYHVATLLQVSEIAKQEKDYATSGELLERALFAFGKSLHPTFAAALDQGKARLNFQRPENREFYLAAWRYITNIGMRATWRTAYEWSKLLLALDPDNDPYCIGLVIDQLAVRARQPQQLLDLAYSRRFEMNWKTLPNIRYSMALAKHTLGKRSSEESTELLKSAVRDAPWIAARLYQQLGLSKAPPAIWGKTAATERDTLYCELYATLAQDLWKLPDATAFLQDTISTLTTKDTEDPVHHNDPITLDEARYVILTDKPPLIGLLPRDLTARVDSMSDPLRPADSIDDYDISEINRATGGERNDNLHTLLQQDPHRFVDEFMTLQQFFENLIPNFAGGQDGDENLTEGGVERVLEASGLGIPEMRQRIRRLFDLRTALSAQPDGRLEVDGAELRMVEGRRYATYTPAPGEEPPTLFGLDPENARRIEQEIQDEMRVLEAAERQEPIE